MAVARLQRHVSHCIMRPVPESSWSIPKRTNREMKCKCGYRFSGSLHPKRCGFKSYAVIRDKDYQKVLALEAKIITASKGAKKLSLIGNASKHIGSLLECPQCSRLLFLKPNGRTSLEGPSFYVAEDLSRGAEYRWQNRPLRNQKFLVERRMQLLDFRLLPAFSGLFQPFQSQPSLTGVILTRAMKGDFWLT